MKEPNICFSKRDAWTLLYVVINGTEERMKNVNSNSIPSIFIYPNQPQRRCYSIEVKFRMSSTPNK